MRKLFWIFLLLLFAIGLGWAMQNDSGYVLIAFDGWSLETSLWVAIILLILIFIFFHWALKCIAGLRSLKAGKNLKQ